MFACGTYCQIDACYFVSRTVFRQQSFYRFKATITTFVSLQTALRGVQTDASSTLKFGRCVLDVQCYYYANMFIHTRTCLQRSRFGSCVKLFHQVWAVCCLRTWFTTNIRVRSLEFNVSNRSHVKLMRHLYMDVRLVQIVHKWLLRLGITSVELSLQLALLSVIRWRVVGLLTI